MNKLKRYSTFNKLKSTIVLNIEKTNSSNISLIEFKSLLDTFKKHIVSNPSHVLLKSKNATKNSK